MAQHIGLELVDEDGELIIDSRINVASVMDALLEIESCKERYPWLTTIDEYGDTIFNRLQIPLVIRELTVLSSEKPELGQVISGILHFLEQSFQDVHQFVKFVGD